MYKSKLSKVIVSLLRRIAGVTRSGAKRLMRAMLQALMAMGRRARLPVAGFVLPTVTMVLLVVILLTVAIVFRSFDRANIARNVRVNQQVLAAATPALDRAKAKIQYILGPGKPTASTPSDQELYRAMSDYPASPDPTKPDLYTFGDEKRLILKFPVNDGSNLTLTDPKAPLVTGTAPAIKENEAINTAWRYPVDTNNDGIFDTFTLYGIYFRSPKVERSRKPLDARTRPMRIGNLNPACTQGEGTVASLVGDSGWERIGAKFQKSFFVYTVNVPITDKDIQLNALDTTYKAFQGTSSISALEYQQDQSRIPLSNNAVVYEDDLDISPGPPLNLNGRIITNSNLLIGGVRDANSVITLFQVSSKNSCFYDRENSKIVVGGNVVNGSATNTKTQPVNVHLFKSVAEANEPDADGLKIDPDNQSVDKDKTSLDVMYNNQAYASRLDALVSKTPQADYPVSVNQAKNQTPAQALEDYFKERLRKVPFAEAPLETDGGAAAATTPFEGSGDINLRPKDSLNWSPNGTTATVGSLTQPGDIKLLPKQLTSRNPDEIAAASETNLGERIVVGNNLPAQRWDGTKFLGINDTQQVDGTATWEGKTGTAKDAIRTRTPQVTKLGEVGATDRGNGTGEEPDTNNPFKDGFWEQAAVEIPKTFLDSVGGLRVITSAGVYDRTNSFLPPPKWVNVTNGATLTADATTFYDDPATPSPAVEKYPVVWPDSMPMSPLGPGSRVHNNSNVAVSGIAAGTWGNWDPTWFSASTPVPSAQNSPNFVVENVATAGQFAKGDLRMRATAVYHYALNTPVPAAGAELEQTPFACVSSYYDPSTASTARNIDGLDDVSGEGSFLIKSPSGDVQRVSPDVIRGTRQKFIGSNNGITYGPPGARPGKSNLDKNTGLLSGGDAILAGQANLVFPDGRFANGPLRTALQVEPTKRTLAQNSAIDSTNCALDILKGATPVPGLIPNGAIQEIAFLNGREIKAIDRDDENTIVNEAFTLSSPLPGVTGEAKLTGNYNQPLEEREPLEIRATQLNIEALRGKTIGTNEWLLPNSGIIYASRDDALPDRSDRSTDVQKSKRLSPSDYRLDPTRKPNGIVLIKGQALFRGGAAPTKPPNLNDLVKEKGLTLVSNLPAYIKGNFNLHGNVPPVKPGDPPLPFKKVEEFTDTVTITDGKWTNFYTRNKTLNPDFACRAGDPRLPDCGGDYWRQANVLVDALTLLSDNYRFGFRNEGDFDLRNNAGAAAVLPRRQQGFFNNNFVTNGLSSGAFSKANGNLALLTDLPNTRLTDIDYVNQTPQPLWSSYFNNFVTPVQRRGKFPEYVMEVCRKLPVSECGDDDWFVDFSTATPQTAAQKLATSATYVAPLTSASFQAGSTVDPPVPALQRFPRRVAFSRTNATPTVLNTPNDPKPLAITATGDISTTIAGRTTSENALWLAGKSGVDVVAYDATSLPYQFNNGSPTPPVVIDGSKVPLPTVDGTSTPLLPPVTVPPTAYKGSQPLLIPVLQLMNVTKADLSPPRGQLSVQQTAWIPQPEVKGTTFNLIMAAGDTPSRALDSANGDFNGGLQNLPRFLEIWSSSKVFERSTNIQGSFIQQNRSAFSTAPYQPILPNKFPADTTKQVASLFALSPTLPKDLELLTTYNIQGGKIPYFTPPLRNWGYDVGLLSQSPDLFTQKFTTPPTKTQPAEYFREVGRDDEWVKTLMCGVQDDGKVATSSRPNKDCFPPS